MLSAPSRKSTGRQPERSHHSMWHHRAAALLHPAPGHIRIQRQVGSERFLQPKASPPPPLSPCLSSFVPPHPLCLVKVGGAKGWGVTTHHSSPLQIRAGDRHPPSGKARSQQGGEGDLAGQRPHKQCDMRDSKSVCFVSPAGTGRLTQFW